jgi:hypothetical protein
MSDVMALCNPLAVEGVVSEPILWSSFANIALSQDVSKISFKDVATLAWTFGKIQALLVEENGENFKNQSDFWSMVVEKALTTEINHMKESSYQSEQVLPALSTICFVLTDISSQKLISPDFWKLLNKALMGSLRAAQRHQHDIENEILDTIVQAVSENSHLENRVSAEVVKF